MAADADMSYLSRRLELPRVTHHGAIRDLAPILRGVAVVYHADVDIIRPQQPQQIGEALAHLLLVACAPVLSVLPRRAEVALKGEFLPPAGERAPKPLAHPGVGRIEVDVVYAARGGDIHQFSRIAAVVVDKSLAAQAYLAYRYSGQAEFSVFH